MRHFFRSRSADVGVGALSSRRTGCQWRDASAAAVDANAAENAAPLGFVRYRQQMARAGAPLTFRLGTQTRLAIRLGCLGAAATSGRFATGGVATSSNPLMCGNRSNWWGFQNLQNVDGVLREQAGPGLAIECASLAPVAPDGVKLLPATARATGAHGLAATCVLHACAPTSFYSDGSEAALRRTYERTLSLANELALPSLALPAFGTGVSGFPAHVSARAAYDAVERVGVDAATTRLEFVLLDESSFNAFGDAAHSRWGR